MKPDDAASQPQPLDRHHLWESFRSDRELLARHHVTESDLETLHTVFLLGDYRGKEDLIEALELLRRGWHS